MKDLTRWGRDYLQVGNAMEIFRRNNVRFIAVNNGIDSENPDTLEFAPFINIMSEWYAKDISKKVKTGIKTKGMSGKPVATEAPYGYIKDPDNKDFWIIDKEAAEVVRLIFRLFLDGKNRNQIAVYLTQEQIPTPTFYMKDRGRGTCKNKTLNENNRYKWNKATLTHILTRQEYCGDVVNFKTAKHFRDKRNHYVDRSQWHITENVHEPIIDRTDFENVQRILENAPVKRPNGDGEIHPLSGLLFCKDCGAKMHIRIDYRNGGKRHVAYCSEYHKGKAKNPKCSSPHIMDADLLSGYVFIVPILILYFLYLRKSGREQSLLHIAAVFVFCYYLFGILTVAGIGYTSTISFSPKISLIPFLGMITGPIDTILNLILFVPLGVFLPFLYKKYHHIKTVALTGFLFSLSVEIVQMFGWGSSDINDLIINTAGACLGYWIYYLLSKALPNNFRKKLQSENVNGTVEVLLFVIYIYMVMVTVQPWVIHDVLNIG